jgi:hypothetical protein
MDTFDSLTRMLLPDVYGWFVADLKVTVTCILITFRKETAVTKFRNSSDLCRVTENVGSMGVSN